MRHETLASMAKKVGKTVTGSTGMESFKGISIDTRTLEPEDIFVALKGPYKDGHDYLKKLDEDLEESKTRKKGIEDEARKRRRQLAS